jgi:predicted acylesterase/phospholipase RssA
LWKTIEIMQYKITIDRLKEDKPDIILKPNISNIWMLDFDKSKDAIQEWINCVRNNELNLKVLTSKKSLKWFIKKIFNF